MDRLAARGNAMELEEAAAPAAAPAADPAPEPVAEKLAEKLAAVEETPAGDKPAAAAPVKVKPAGKVGHTMFSFCQKNYDNREYDANYGGQPAKQRVLHNPLPYLPVPHPGVRNALLWSWWFGS